MDTTMTTEERARKTFEAAIGCTSAAVDFLRSVNKPLNATYIAQTAWDIARKLEDLMEQGIEKGVGAGTSSVVGSAMQAKPGEGQTFKGSESKPKGEAPKSDADLIPMS
jgi:hypothetical protein